MKFKSPNLVALIITAIITVLAALLLIAFLNIKATAGGTGTTESHTLPANDTAFGGLFDSFYLNDSLPHSEYAKAEADFNTKKKMTEMQNDGTFATGFTAMSLRFYSIPKQHTSYNKYRKHDSLIKKTLHFLDSISIKMTTETDSAKVKKLQFQLDSINEADNKVIEIKNDLGIVNNSNNNLLYFGLPGYTLSNWNTRFFIQDDKNYLAYVKYDTVYKTKYGENKNGHYERKEIRPRYVKKDEALLFPVKQSTYTFFYYSSYAAALLLTILFGYFIIGLPVQVLLNIAKGKVFTANNINSLRKVSLAVGIICGVKILFPYLLHWLYADSIPDDFSFISFTTVLKENSMLLITLVIVLAIHTAFKKGYKLQQEQEFTI